MRATIVDAPVGNFRHNFGVDRGTYVHRALDLFVPIGTPMLTPGDGILTDFNPQDLGAGGFWSRYKEDTGYEWYFAHNLDVPYYPRGTRLPAGTPFQKTGWTGNAGLGNANTKGRRTEPHLHTSVKLRVNGIWRYCDPWEALCRLWGFDPGRYSHNAVRLPAVISKVDLPLKVDAPTTAPSSPRPGAVPAPAPPEAPADIPEAVERAAREVGEDPVEIGIAAGKAIVDGAKLAWELLRTTLEEGIILPERERE